MEVSSVKDLSIIAAGVVAVTTFLSGVWEYRRKQRWERAQIMIDMRRRFLETPDHRDILERLLDDDPRIAEIPLPRRRSFAGFLEEVALLANSGLIRRRVALFLFGFYILKVADCDAFWTGIDRESVFWTQFRLFERQARKEARKLAGSQRAARL